MNIAAQNLDFRELNSLVNSAEGSISIDGCCGQRFIGCASKGKKIIINGTPGNALGAYLDGSFIEVNGNAQDAAADTMNDGRIVIRGSAGDALGYAMRGGSVFVQGNTGYRTGIHMKEYEDKKPVIVIGGRAGSFLGEYLAGGLIIVLGIGSEDVPVGNFTGTGMHGGRIFIRTDKELSGLPEQVTAETAGEDDLDEIAKHVIEFSSFFGTDAQQLLKEKFCVLKPNAKNPYTQMYTAN